MSKSVNEKMGGTHPLNNSSTHPPERGETMKTHEDLGIWKEGLDTISLNNSSTLYLMARDGAMKFNSNSQRSVSIVYIAGKQMVKYLKL